MGLGLGEGLKWGWRPGTSRVSVEAAMVLGQHRDRVSGRGGSGALSPGFCAVPPNPRTSVSSQGGGSALPAVGLAVCARYVKA